MTECESEGSGFGGGRRDRDRKGFRCLPRLSHPSLGRTEESRTYRRVRESDSRVEPPE